MKQKFIFLFTFMPSPTPGFLAKMSISFLDHLKKNPTMQKSDQWVKNGWEKIVDKQGGR